VAPTRTKTRRTTPDPIREDGVGRDVLEARAGILEMAVAKLPGVTPDAMQAQRPGGSENRDPSAMGWLSYLCWLSAEYAKGPAVPKSSGLRWDAQAMNDLRAALAEEPVYVTLQSGRRVSVHPKGEAALHRLAVNQVALAWANEQHMGMMMAMEREATAEGLHVLRLASDAVSRLRAEFVAIVTHPGPWVPWDDEATWDHPIPAWTRDEVTPLDLATLRQAYLEVNVHRVNAIAARTRQFGSGGDAMPLPAFMGVMAEELKVKPEEFVKRYSIGAVFAMAFTKFEASERAKAKADAEKPAPNQTRR
jgi:hypothetical protein